MKNSDAGILAVPGGLTAILQENHDTPVVSVLVYVRVGSVDEGPSQEGLAHLHEHMIFKGTPTRPVGKIAAEIEGAGGEINAYTTHDHTCYYVTMSSRFWEVGLDVLADAITNAAFDPGELAKELHVVSEEMAKSDDSPMHRVSSNLFKSVFRGHPYGRRIIGLRKSLRTVTRKDILAFFRNYYAPSNVILVLAGDFSAERAEPRIRRLFGEGKKRRTARLKLGSLPPQRRLRAIIEIGDVQETTFEIGFRGPGLGHPDSAAMDVLSLILGVGETSRLHREVKRRRKIVHEAFAYHYSLKDTGLFAAGAVCETRKAAAAVKSVAREIVRIREGGVTPAELDKAKRNIEAGFIYERETPSGLAKKLGFSFFYAGDLEFDDRYLARVGAVTSEDVRRCASAYLRYEKASLSLVKPGKRRGRGAGAKLKAALSLLRNVRPPEAAIPAPTPPFALGSTRAVKGSRHRLEMTRLASGVRVIVKESTQAPIFAMKACLFGGTRSETRADAGISRFIADLLTKGSRRKTADEFSEAVESLAGSLDGFSGRNSLGMSGEFLSKNFEQGMELFAEALLEPVFPESEIDLQKRDQLASLLRREDMADRKCLDLFSETLFRKHPYGLNALGTEKSVASVTRRRLQKFYRRILRPEHLVVSIVGDVRLEYAVEITERLFGGLRASGDPIGPPRPEPGFDKPRKAARYKDKEQAHLVVGFLGASIVSPDRHAMEVVNAILAGQGGRLFLELRERRHLAYTVTSFNSEGIDPGAFGVYIGTSPRNVDEAREAIWTQLDLLRNELVSSESLEKTKRFLVGIAEIDMAHMSTTAQAMALDELMGLSYKNPFRLAERIGAVTAEQIREAANKYFSKSAFAEALITTEQK